MITAVLSKHTHEILAQYDVTLHLKTKHNAEDTDMRYRTKWSPGVIIIHFHCLVVTTWA